MKKYIILCAVVVFINGCMTTVRTPVAGGIVAAPDTETVTTPITTTSTTTTTIY